MACEMFMFYAGNAYHRCQSRDTRATHGGARHTRDSYGCAFIRNGGRGTHTLGAPTIDANLAHFRSATMVVLFSAFWTFWFMKRCTSSKIDASSAKAAAAAEESRCAFLAALLARPHASTIDLYSIADNVHIASLGTMIAFWPRTARTSGGVRGVRGGCDALGCGTTAGCGALGALGRERLQTIVMNARSPLERWETAEREGGPMSG